MARTHTHAAAALAIAIAIAVGSHAVAVSAATTWSGGHAGITLNDTGVTIFDTTTRKASAPGQMTHWWCTGGNKTLIDNAIVSVYVDGETTPSIQFQPNMASGTGWVDMATPCNLGDCWEQNSNWGNQWVGKGSGMGGWYNDLRIPFSKSLRATIQAPFSTKPLKGAGRHALGSASSSSSSSADTCPQILKDTDLWGNDLPGHMIQNVSSADACCALCASTSGCGAWTWHPPGAFSGAQVCFLKSNGSGRQTSPGNFSGELPMWAITRGVDYWGSDLPASVQPAVPVASADACADACESTSGCAAWTHYDVTDITAAAGHCFLKSLGAAASAVPSATTATSGCISDGKTCVVPQMQDASLFVLIRGVFGSSGAGGDFPIDINGFTVPDGARLRTQYRAIQLQPLDYFPIMNVSATDLQRYRANNNVGGGASSSSSSSTSSSSSISSISSTSSSDALSGGAVAMFTQSVISGTANFMEGCYRYEIGGEGFPGLIMATGTEDYFNSGVSLGAAALACPTATATATSVRRFTFNVPFTDAIGPLTKGGLRWSVYRTHMVEQLVFEDGGAALIWRNGDVADPGVGKCLHEGAGPPVGNPTVSFVRVLAYVYTW